MNSTLPKMFVTKLNVKWQDLYWMTDVVQRDTIIVYLLIDQMMITPLCELCFIYIFTDLQAEDPHIPANDARRGSMSEI